MERDFSVMYPSSLFTKPILGVQDFIQSIHTYSSKVDEVCSPLSVFPAFMERDFMYPALLIKVPAQVMRQAFFLKFENRANFVVVVFVL